MSVRYQLVASRLGSAKRNEKTLTAPCLAHKHRRIFLSARGGEQTDVADSANFEREHGQRVAAHSPDSDLPLLQGVVR
jgi:hypothetical protein